MFLRSLILCYIEQFTLKKTYNRIFLILKKQILGNSKIYTAMHNEPVLCSFILHVVRVIYLMKESKYRKPWPIFMYQTCFHNISYKVFVYDGQVSNDIFGPDTYHWYHAYFSFMCTFLISYKTFRYIYIYIKILIYFTFNLIHNNLSRF